MKNEKKTRRKKKEKPKQKKPPRDKPKPRRSPYDESARSTPRESRGPSSLNDRPDYHREC